MFVMTPGGPQVIFVRNYTVNYWYQQLEKLRLENGVKLCSQKKKKHTVWSSTFFSSHCLSASKPWLCVLLEPSLSPFLIQLLTPVYAIVLSEDSRGCKLYLEATSTVEKKKEPLLRAEVSVYFRKNPEGKWKLKNHRHCGEMRSKWS